MQSEREILERVAAGDLSPQEAAELLGEVPGDEGAAAPGDQGPIRRVRFVGTFRSATIVGDPAVREAVVDGPHVVRREGDVLVVGDDTNEDHGGFVGRIDRQDGGAFRFRSVRKTKVIVSAEGPFGPRRRPSPIEIRMNPDLPLDVELAAGTLSVRGVRGPITAEISAGSARIEGFERPIEIQVAAGSVHATGVMNAGGSRVKCEAGSVAIHLLRGSSVRIASRVGLGKVEIPDDAVEGGNGFVLGVGARQGTVGEGLGTLDIDCSLGKVAVTAER